MLGLPVPGPRGFGEPEGIPEGYTRQSRKIIRARPGRRLASDRIRSAGASPQFQQVHHMAEDLVVLVVLYLPGHGFV